MFGYLENILSQIDCGELCNTSRDGIACPFFNKAKSNILCNRLFRNLDIDRGYGETRASNDMPAELKKH